jgi:hypothetical protein
MTGNRHVRFWRPAAVGDPAAEFNIPGGGCCRVRIYLPEEEQDAPVMIRSELATSRPTTSANPSAASETPSEAADGAGRGRNRSRSRSSLLGCHLRRAEFALDKPIREVSRPGLEPGT